MYSHVRTIIDSFGPTVHLLTLSIESTGFNVTRDSLHSVIGANNTRRISLPYTNPPL